MPDTTVESITSTLKRARAGPVLPRPEQRVLAKRWCS